MLDCCRYAAGRIRVDAGTLSFAFADAGAAVGRGSGFCRADAGRLARAAAVGRVAGDVFCGAVSGGGIRRLPADAARTHGQGRFCSVVFRICAVAFGACRFLFYGHGCQGAAECRAGRLSAATDAVPPFLPDAGGALDGLGRFDCGGMAAVAGTDAAP